MCQVAITEQDSVLLNEVRNDRSLRDLFLQEASEFECNEQLDIRGKLAIFFKEKLEQIKIDNTARQQRNKNSVSLMSMHGVKGLEFDVVFVAQAVDGEMPLTCNDDDDDADDKEDDVSPQWPLPPTQRCDVQEERRLFYVAMTRARKRLVLAWMEAVGKTLHSMSPFIEEIPRKYLVVLHKHKRNLPAVEQSDAKHSTPAKGSATPPAAAQNTPHSPGVEAQCVDMSHNPSANQTAHQPNETPTKAPEQQSAGDTAIPDGDVPENKENSDKRRFLCTLSQPCKSILSKLALKWGQQKAFSEPARLVAKLRAFLDRRCFLRSLSRYWNKFNSGSIVVLAQLRLCWAGLVTNAVWY